MFLTPAMTPAIAAGDDDHAHKHGEWKKPPPEYAGAKSTRWSDLAAITRGQVLYQQLCQSCHGSDGRGTGPSAAALSHKPADLTNHFHAKPGDGDAYLFWRVSEGGSVEPFKSMGSVMPPFKTILNEDQRWDMLAYVHAFFHLGLGRWDVDVAESVSVEHGGSDHMPGGHGKE